MSFKGAFEPPCNYCGGDHSVDDCFQKGLKEVITGLAERADAERQKEKPYEDLFKASENGLSSLLSEANHQMTHVALNLADVIKAKFGIKMSDKLWKLIKALPIAMHELRQGITEQEGNSCCADKTRRIYYEEVLAEINRIKEQDI